MKQRKGKDQIMISSRDNNRIKNVVRLIESARERKKQSLIVLEGERLVKEASEIEELYYTEDYILEEIIKKSKKSFLVSKEVFKKMSDTVSPQGVIALVKRPEKITELNKNGKYIAFENVQDPGNLGTAARTAEALGIDGLIINGVDVFSPKAIRASMGAVLRIPIIEPQNILEYIKNANMRIVGTVCKEGKSIKDFTFKNDIVLIGNEANGLTANAISICDEIVTIKMNGKAESLNAAAASSIICWEMTK